MSVGAAKPQDFDEHLKTLEYLDHASEMLPPILERLEQAAIDRLGADWMQTWQVGLPTPAETPGGLNIPVMLWLRNLAIAYDMVDFGRMRYNLLGQGSHWFPGGSGDRVAELDLRQCLANSPHADKIPTLLVEAHALLGGQTIKRLSQQ